MHFAELGISLVHVHLGHAVVPIAQFTSIRLICLLLLANNIFFLSLTRNDIVEEDFLSLLLDVRFTLLTHLQVFSSLRV